MYNFIKTVYILCFCYYQDTQEMDFKKFLMAVHGVNTDELNNYVTIIYDKNMLEVNIYKIMKDKFNSIQKAFWFDTREQKPQGIYVMK